MENTLKREKNEDIDSHTHKIWANKIRHVLTSDEVPENVKQILSDVFISAANEINIGIDAPEIITTSFPLMMSRLSSGYRLGILHSLQSIVEAGIPESVFDELCQYETRYSSETNDVLSSEILEVTND